MKSYYEYEVSVWEKDLQRAEQYYGVTYGDTYQEALSTLIDYYGEQELESIKIEPWDVSGCLVMSKEALRDLRESSFI
jgi:hypothetical protein